MTADPRPAPGGIACREFVEIVTDYLEGTMPSDLRVRFEAHLAGCEGCTGYLDQMRETLRVTGALGEESVPAVGRDRLLSAFRGWRGGRSGGTRGDA